MNIDSQNNSAPEMSGTGRRKRRGVGWTIFRRAIIAAVGLVTLLALVCTIETWRGKRAWQRYRAEWEAKGERFDFASFQPKPVPADQNLWDVLPQEGRAVDQVDIAAGKDPAQAVPSLGNWERGTAADLGAWQDFYHGNTNFPDTSSITNSAHAVLTALGKYDPLMEGLTAAERRPYAQMPPRSSEDLEGIMRSLATVRSVVQLLRLHGSASLEYAQAENALRDVRLSVRLEEGLGSEPLLISHLVRLAVVNQLVQPVWEGLAAHRWNNAQLHELQRLMQAVDLLSAYTNTMRGERAFGLEGLVRFRSGQFDNGDKSTEQRGVQSALSLAGIGPGLWLYQNQIAVARLCQEVVLPMVDPQQHRIYPLSASDAANAPVLKRKSFYNIFARQLLPAIERSAPQTARAQTAIDLALVACALERFRLAESRYPEKLAALAPRFLTTVPPDIMTGEPLKYRLTSDGRFVLYSVGLDQKDNGGAPAGRGRDGNTGDWVWRYPEGNTN